MALVTLHGLEALKREQVRLVEEEKEAIEAIVIARGFGDFSENAELESAKGWMQRIQQKMSEIDGKIRTSEVIDSSNCKRDSVNFGAEVLLQDCETEKQSTYKIVGEDEADVACGKISYKSPLAAALRGKNIGDECVVATPAGEKYYEIKQLSYDWLKN